MKANCPERDEYPRVSPTPSPSSTPSPTPSLSPTPSPSPVIEPKRVYFSNWAEKAYRLTMFGTQRDVVGTYSGFVYTDQTWILYPTENKGVFIMRNGRKIERVLTVMQDLSLITTVLPEGEDASGLQMWKVQDPEDPQYPEGAVMLRSMAFPLYVIKMTGKGIGGLGMSDAYADASHLWKVVDCDLELSADKQAVCYP